MIEFLMSITFLKKTDQAKTIGNVSDFQSGKGQLIRVSSFSLAQ